MSNSFNFPANPTLNQIVTLPDGNQAQWNGYAWVSVEDNVTYPLGIPLGGTGATNPLTAKRNLAIPIFTLDDTMPAAPVYGDRWVRPGSMTEVVWLPNANNAGVWVNLADVGSIPYPLAVAKGGTGAVDAATARLNLGITNASSQYIIGDGSVAAPGLAYANELGLGMYRKSAGVIGWAQGGGQSMNLDASAAAMASLQLTPRVAGGSVFSLSNGPSGAANYNYFNTLIASDGSVTVINAGVGTAAPKAVTFNAQLFNFNGTGGGGGVTFNTSTLTTTSPTSCIVTSDKAAGVNTARFSGTRLGVQRWTMELGDFANETGSNAGSNFSINGSNDAGTQIRSNLNINRATGAVTFVMGNNAGFAITTEAGPVGNLNLSNPGGSVRKLIRVSDSTNDLEILSANFGKLIFGLGDGGALMLGNGVRTKFGATGGVQGNTFNIGWTTVAYLYIDDTQLGPISIASDERIKKNIEPLAFDMDAFLRVQPIKYRFRDVSIFSDDGMDHWGFSAQNLRRNLPLTVIGEEGAMTQSGGIQPLTLDPHAVSAQLWLAVKALHARLAALEAA